jgi:hypothetical protein
LRKDEIMGVRRWLGASAAIFASAMLLCVPVSAQENLPPVFGPPLQYTSKPGHEYEALLATNLSWLKSKLKDRKRRRREAQNAYRIEPAATKPQVQALIELLDKEVKETETALAVFQARPPDPAAQKQLVKSNVEAWIKALHTRTENYRKFADEAEAKAKQATKQLEAARYRLDVDDDKQIADKAEQEAEALTKDLQAAGL